MVQLGVALGTRKDELNGVEKALEGLFGFFDDLFRVFGVRSNLSRAISKRVGALKVSDNNHTVPKIIPFNGNSIPSNYRDVFSAEVLWNKYHNDKSFVVGDFGGQYKIVSARIPFTLNDFVKVVDNGEFLDEDGQPAQMLDFEWAMLGDYANIRYKVKEVYTTNLKETIKIGGDD